MDTERIAKLLNARLKEKAMTLYQMHVALTGRVSKQTVYNAFAGKPVRIDTLITICKELGMEIVIK
jgi:DNA-binding phage protein